VLYRNEMHQTCHDRMKVGDYAETDGDERHQLSHILCCDFEYRLTAAGFTVAAFLFVVGVHRNLGPIRVSLGKRQAVVIAIFAWVAAVGLCLLSVCDTCGRFEAYHMIGAGMFYVGGFGIMFATTATWRTVEGKCVCNYHSSLHWETDERYWVIGLAKVFSLAGGMMTLFLWWADPFLGQLLAIATILLTCLSLQFDATYLGGPEVIPFTDT